MDQMNAVCRELKDKLSDYLDGELESALCAQIEQHLRGCDDCRVVVDTLNQTITLYRNYGQATVPPDTHERLTRVLKLERLKSKPPSTGSLGPSSA
jgi:predicted anti-sigma-YlaC factor YlaD